MTVWFHRRNTHTNSPVPSLPVLLLPTLLSFRVERFTATILNRYIFSNQTQLTEHLFFGNKRSIVIAGSLWSFGCLEENKNSDTLCLTIISLKQVFHRLFFSLCFVAFLHTHPDVSFFVPPDDANLVSENTEIVDVSPSITTNVIGQKTDEMGADMCERSCEELSTMFQELKGLRVVVSNLIDGLRKVVSIERDNQTL